MLTSYIETFCEDKIGQNIRLIKPLHWNIRRKNEIEQHFNQLKDYLHSSVVHIIFPVSSAHNSITGLLI